jgi:hypothetical protein
MGVDPAEKRQPSVLDITHTPMSKLIYLLDDDGEATGKKKFINKSEVAVDVDTSE